MNTFYNFSRFLRRRLVMIGGIFLAVSIIGASLVSAVLAAGQLSLAGFVDFTYGINVLPEPTDGRPESKLWYNDGSWWAIMYKGATYKIFKLDWRSQNWQDTGVKVDDREESRSDVLWDQADQKLYVVSHIKQDNPSHTKNANNWAWLYRYSYMDATQSYSLDADFPFLISEDITRSMVLDKDSTGRLWITYVSREPQGSGTAEGYRVYVNTSLNGNDLDWGVPFALSFPEATVDMLDLSAVIAFDDNGPPKVGILWSNALTGKFYFASHPDSANANTGWTLETMPDIPYPSNDHVNLKKNAKGQLFAAIKTHADFLVPAQPTAPLIGLITRDVDGTFAFHSVSPVESNDTRPIVVLYDGEPQAGDEEVYVISTSNSVGGAVCYQAAPVVTPLSAISFPGRSCGDPGLAGADQILSDTLTYTFIDNPTTTKQVLNSQTNMVILASEDIQKTYVHAVVTNPLPMVVRRSPVGQKPIGDNASVQVSFSEDMNPATINSNTFRVNLESTGAPVPGTVTYYSSNRTAVFTPQNGFSISTRYTVTLTEGIQDESGESLLGSPIDWLFILIKENLYLPAVLR